MSPSRSRSSRHRAASSSEVRLASRRRSTMRCAHFRGGLPREGDGENVIGIDAGEQEVDIALDEHARLAGAGRGLQHDVLRRIDGGSRAAAPHGQTYPT